MRIAVSVIVVLVCVLISAGVASEQPAAAPDAAQSGPKAAAFTQTFSEWKTLLTELRELREEYGSASADRQKEIAARYDVLVEKGTAMQPELTKAAEAAYIESGGDNKELEQFMMATCAGNIVLDNYEEALRLAEVLLATGCEDKGVYVWGGTAAFCVGELDKAEEYLNVASEKGANMSSRKENLDAIIEEFLRAPSGFKKKWQKELALRQAEAEADDLPRVLLKTSQGDIEVELFENEAPIATANFISLVEQGFYDGLTFHRVLDGFMAQGGCPLGDGTGGPDYHIPCECKQPNHRNHFRGSLSMAHAGPNTGGSQFFLTFVPTTFLDGRHTVFGRVVAGIDVLAKIRRRDPSDTKATLPHPDEIIEAKVLRKRPHEYVPEKLEK